MFSVNAERPPCAGKDFGRKPEGDREPTERPIRSANAARGKARTDEGEREKDEAEVLHGSSPG